jgi:arsenate reductase
LQVLRERQVDFDAVEYLKQPLDRAALERLLGSLSDPPADLVRKDKRFAELGLRPEDYTSREQVVALLVEHPELMQRPIVIQGDRALIARPGERVLEIL